MFGHQDDEQNNTPAVAYGGPPAEDSLGSGSSHDVVTTGQGQPAPQSSFSSQPAIQPTAQPEPAPQQPAPSNGNAISVPVTTSGDEPRNDESQNKDDLLSIKQQALQQLSPIVGQLDQKPEEKFRTIMMMIQASDDQSMIKDAYEAAKQIGDEKVKAQALLDIVNEINYFTHPDKEDATV